MSAPVPAVGIGQIDILPAYLGETPHGERVLGGDTDFLADMLIRHLIVEAVKPAQAPSETVSRETSKALASFSKLDNALRQLLDAPESDEFGLKRPTRASIKLAKKTLFPLVQRGFGFPEAVDVGTDHDGAIRIVWENGPRFLELIVPREGDADAYFYYSDEDHYAFERDLKLAALRERFKWLCASTN
jgi:hypothetical protein